MKTRIKHYGGYYYPQVRRYGFWFYTWVGFGGKGFHTLEAAKNYLETDFLYNNKVVWGSK